VLCACDLIQLFAVAFRAVRAVHKFDFRHVINEKIKPTSCSGRYSCFERICTFSPSRRRECYGTLNQAVLVICMLMSDISTDNDCGVCS
jgi:hypothetical protein